MLVIDQEQKLQALQSQQPPQTQESQERAQDVGKSKLMTQQLGLLLHAQNCLKEEKERKFTMPPSYNGGCYKPHCKTTMKTVLIHMSSCLSDRKCQLTHCSSSRQILGLAHDMFSRMYDFFYQILCNV